MNEQTDKELLEAIKTREELERRGYTRRRCGACYGVCWTGYGKIQCRRCDGEGFWWEAPLMR